MTTDANLTPDPAAKGDGKTGFVPPEDGSWIPRDRFDEATGKLRDEVARLTGRIEEISKQPAKEPEKPRTFTRAELDAAVAAGTITQAQADAQIEAQTERKIDEKVERKLQAKTVGERIETEIARYTAAIPGVDTPGTPERQRVERAFKRLVANGSPDTVATELAALEIAFGPAEGLKRSDGGRRETHQETTTSGGRGHDRPDSDSSGAPRDLPGNLKAHYQRLIDNGMYADGGWASPKLKSELKNVRSTRQRAA